MAKVSTKLAEKFEKVKKRYACMNNKLRLNELQFLAGHCIQTRRVLGMEPWNTNRANFF